MFIFLSHEEIQLNFSFRSETAFKNAFPYFKAAISYCANDLLLRFSFVFHALMSSYTLLYNESPHDMLSYIFIEINN